MSDIFSNPLSVSAPVFPSSGLATGEYLPPLDPLPLSNTDSASQGQILNEVNAQLEQALQDSMPSTPDDEDSLINELAESIYNQREGFGNGSLEPSESSLFGHDRPIDSDDEYSPATSFSELGASATGTHTQGSDSRATADGYGESSTQSSVRGPSNTSNAYSYADGHGSSFTSESYKDIFGNNGSTVSGTDGHGGSLTATESTLSGTSHTKTSTMDDGKGGSATTTQTNGAATSSSSDGKGATGTSTKTDGSKTSSVTNGKGATTSATNTNGSGTASTTDGKGNTTTVTHTGATSSYSRTQNGHTETATQTGQLRTITTDGHTKTYMTSQSLEDYLKQYPTI